MRLLLLVVAAVLHLGFAAVVLDFESMLLKLLFVDASLLCVLLYPMRYRF